MRKVHSNRYYSKTRRRIRRPLRILLFLIKHHRLPRKGERAQAITILGVRKPP